METGDRCVTIQSRLPENFLRNTGYFHIRAKDRYTRGSKPYIWRKMCTKDYENLSDAMRDLERVEAGAHRRLKNIAPAKRSSIVDRGRAPMDIGKLELKKFTLVEMEKCIKEGRCLRCREKRHLAHNFPKGRENY